MLICRKWLNYACIQLWISLLLYWIERWATVTWIRKKICFDCIVQDKILFPSFSLRSLAGLLNGIIFQWLLLGMTFYGIIVMKAQTFWHGREWWNERKTDWGKRHASARMIGRAWATCKSKLTGENHDENEVRKMCTHNQIWI